ncbi:SNAP25 homologous protein SNAP33 [Linum grandiflorum]
MFGLTKSPLRIPKHNKVDQQHAAPAKSNPFDSDDESPSKETMKLSKRSASEPDLSTQGSSTNPFDDVEDKGASSSSSRSHVSNSRNKYKNDFRDSGGIENQSVQELEDYAVYKAEETTKAVNGCLKIAEDIREDASKTLITLHHQGEQITRSHNVAVELDNDLSRGERLLGSLGGMFSKTWKPKKTRPVSGPVITKDDSHRRGNHLQQREKLGLNTASKGVSTNARTLPTEPTNAYQKVEVEKAKQDDAFSDLSNLLGELKDMAVDMGTEIDKQTKALDHYQDDVDVLDIRVKGANQRTRRLLGKLTYSLARTSPASKWVLRFCSGSPYLAMFSLWKLKITNLPKNSDSPVLKLMTTDGFNISAFTATLRRRRRAAVVVLKATEEDLMRGVCYILDCKVSDKSAETWISAFTEEAEKILGCTADELYQLKSEFDKNAYSAKLAAATWNQHLFRVSVTQKDYNNKKMQRITSRKHGFKICRQISPKLPICTV